MMTALRRVFSTSVTKHLQHHATTERLQTRPNSLKRFHHRQIQTDVTQRRNLLGSCFACRRNRDISGNTDPRRHLSTDNESPQRKVWVSQSQNIFSNLALEDWLYKNRSFHDDDLLLLWRNEPCIVIGRHQNPWRECDVTGCAQDGVRVARRNSGGGAVYHDLGNLCVSFFTRRDRYDRKANLELVVEAVTAVWPVHLSVNSRDDILLDHTHKISGTAAKLGGKTAYHHCTLLTDVNKENLQKYLTTKMVGLDSRATESVRSEVKNLREAHPSISFEGLVAAISRRFLQDTPKQTSVEYVDPCADFPGLAEAQSELENLRWIYDRTPKFTIRRSFVDRSHQPPKELNVVLEIDKGRISQIELEGDILGDFPALRTMITLNLQNRVFLWRALDDTLEKGYANVMDIESAKVYLWIWQCFRNIFG